MLKKYKTIDEYIKTFPKTIQEKLKEIRKIIKQIAPKAEETISYGIPTFKLNGNLVHFAAYEKHIGFYPGPAGIKIFKEELKNYKTSKGAIQFPLEQQIPYNLIKKIVKFRVKQNLEKHRK